MDKTNINTLSDTAIVAAIGAYIKHHRLEQNKTQSQLAKDAGIEMNIKKGEHIVNQIADVVSNWKDYASQVNVEKKLKEAIAKTLIKL